MGGMNEVHLTPEQLSEIEAAEKRNLRVAVSVPAERVS